MNRRTNSISGCVNFPINDPSWTSTKEGGMFVKLVVIDDRDIDDQFGECCGANVYDFLQECLIGDDQRPRPVFIQPTDISSHSDLVKSYEDENNLQKVWKAFHYPNVDNELNPELSRDYLFSAVLGTTGWSGSNENNDYWICHYDDLNDAGKMLYKQVQDLYPGCQLHLLTFLDT